MTPLISKIRRLTITLSLLFLTVGCDQITKAIARETLTNQGSLNFFKDRLIFVHAENPGAFLSLGSHLNETARF